MTAPTSAATVFGEQYRQWVARAAKAAEPPAEAYLLRHPGLDEGFVRHIWFDQKLRLDELRTEDGRPLKVISPGWWNIEAGPDFLNAELSFADEPARRASVELHLAATDWRAHGHHIDAAYREVGLHAFLINDSGDAFALADNGRRIPQLALARFLARDLDDLREEAGCADESADKIKPRDSAGPCRQVFAAKGLGDAWVADFLDAAGDERLLRKAEAFAEQLQTATPDQAIYEGLMDALGYRNNRVPFRRLARRLPIAEARSYLREDGDVGENALTAEAMLLHVAGLAREVPDADEETSAYLASLQECWRRMARSLSLRAMRAGEWDCRATRPLNYPTRRISGAAILLARYAHYGLFRAIRESFERSRTETRPARRTRRLLAELRGLFGAKDESGYWARHCVLGGKRLSRGQSVVGRDRATIMAVNVVLPALLCEARRHGEKPLEETTHELYSALPRLQENQRTRYVAGRLFPTRASAGETVNSARRQQGLMQLYRDCCGDVDRTCADCALLTAMGARS